MFAILVLMVERLKRPSRIQHLSTAERRLKVLAEEVTVDYRKYRHLSGLRSTDLNIKPFDEFDGSVDKSAFYLRVPLAAFPQEVQDGLEGVIRMDKKRGEIKICGKRFQDRVQNEKDVFKRLSNAIEKAVRTKQETESNEQKTIPDQSPPPVENVSQEEEPGSFTLKDVKLKGKYKYLRHLKNNDVKIKAIKPGGKSGGQNLNKNKTKVDLRVHISKFGQELQDKIDQLSKCKSIEIIDNQIINIKEQKKKSFHQNKKTALIRLNNAIETVLNPKKPSEEKQRETEEKIQHRQAAAKRRSMDSNKKDKQKRQQRQGNRIL